MANLNPKDNSYALKDFVFRDVQRDWPGYSEDDRTEVDRILTRYTHARTHARISSTTVNTH